MLNTTEWIGPGITPAKAAERLGVSRMTVQNMVTRQMLRARYVPGAWTRRRRWEVDAAHVDEVKATLTRGEIPPSNNTPAVPA